LARLFLTDLVCFLLAFEFCQVDDDFSALAIERSQTAG
jgi:hypothetical protein